MLLAEGERLRRRETTPGRSSATCGSGARPEMEGPGRARQPPTAGRGERALLDGDAERGLRLLGELCGPRSRIPRAGRQARGLLRRPGGSGRSSWGCTRSAGRSSTTPSRWRRATRQSREVRDVPGEGEGSPQPPHGRGPGARRAHRGLCVWPTLEGADAAYREAFAAVPTLDVAVDDVPRASAPGSARRPTPASPGCSTSRPRPGRRGVGLGARPPASSRRSSRRPTSAAGWSSSCARSPLVRRLRPGRRRSTSPAP